VWMPMSRVLGRQWGLAIMVRGYVLSWWWVFLPSFDIDLYSLGTAGSVKWRCMARIFETRHVGGCEAAGDGDRALRALNSSLDWSVAWVLSGSSFVWTGGLSILCFGGARETGGIVSSLAAVPGG